MQGSCLRTWHYCKARTGMFWRFVCKLLQNLFCFILTDHRGPGDRGFKMLLLRIRHHSRSGIRAAQPHLFRWSFLIWIRSSPKYQIIARRETKLWIPHLFEFDSQVPKLWNRFLCNPLWNVKLEGLLTFVRSEVMWDSWVHPRVWTQSNGYKICPTSQVYMELKHGIQELNLNLVQSASEANSNTNFDQESEVMMTSVIE